ncbi:hypothetical protein M6B38_196910 [Iris pallida]|uniref:Uncharacterized protein n=1 Tax=Iris pallida TaxID=29817 RepID=A0AAX6ECE6_IRIPA|nr:hypothetical protein M6B38_196910 [Iris pallida]
MFSKILIVLLHINMLTYSLNIYNPTHLNFGQLPSLFFLPICCYIIVVLRTMISRILFSCFILVQ